MTACRLEESVVLEIAQAANVCAGREEQNKAEQSRAEQRWRGASETRPRLRRTARLSALCCTTLHRVQCGCRDRCWGDGGWWCGVVWCRLGWTLCALRSVGVRCGDRWIVTGPVLQPNNWPTRPLWLARPGAAGPVTRCANRRMLTRLRQRQCRWRRDEITDCCYSGPLTDYDYHTQTHALSSWTGMTKGHVLAASWRWASGGQSVGAAGLIRPRMPVAAAHEPNTSALGSDAHPLPLRANSCFTLPCPCLLLPSTVL